MGNVDQEYVSGWLRGSNLTITTQRARSARDRQRLRGAYHVFGRCNKFDDAVVQLCPLPSVGGSIRLLIPVEELRDFVAQIAHAAFPAVAAFDEGDEWVDVGSAAATSCDDRIGHYWDFGIALLQ